MAHERPQRQQDSPPGPSHQHRELENGQDETEPRPGSTGPYSPLGGLPLVVPQQAAQPLPTPHRPFLCPWLSCLQTAQDSILFPLMVALLVVMRHVLPQRSPQRKLPEQDELRQERRLQSLFQESVNTGVQDGLGADAGLHHGIGPRVGEDNLSRRSEVLRCAISSPSSFLTIRHCPRASNGLLPRRSNLVGYVRWDGRSDQSLLSDNQLQQLYQVAARSDYPAPSV